MSKGIVDHTSHQYARATIAMLLATFLFGVMSAVIKRFSTVPTSQLMFFRSTVALLAIVLFILVTKQSAALHTRRIRVHVLRGLFGVVSMGCTFAAVQELPLATASALIHTKALFIAPLAAMLLGETFYGRRIMLTLLGFSGIAIMLNPTAPEISSGVLFAVLGALIGSIAMICVRSLGQTEPSITVVFYFMLTASVVSAILCFFDWQPIESVSQLIILSAIGITGVLGQSAMVVAYRAAEASFVAPLDYIQLVWAAMFGFFFWGELPTVWVLFGAVIVVVSQVLLQKHAYGIRAHMVRKADQEKLSGLT